MINAIPHTPATPPTSADLNGASGVPAPETPMYTATKAAPYGQAPKRSGLSLKTVLAAVVLAIVLIGGGAGLYLTQRSQETRQQASTGVATPECGSSCQGNTDCPSAHTCSANKCVLTQCLSDGTHCDANKCVITNAAACTLNFVATPSNTPISCDKTAFRDEFSNSAGNYQLLTQQTNFNPGDTVVFRINMTNNGQSTAQISLKDPLTGNNLNNFTFVDSDCGDTAYDSTTRILTCPAAAANAGATITHTFRVKLGNSVAPGTTLVNTANIAAGQDEASCSVSVTVNGASPSPSPSPTPTPNTYSCNSSCTSDEQCRSVNAGYICSLEAGNRCRLDTNRGSETCTPAENTYACNSSCTSNAQCQTASSSYICYNDRCRLDSNVAASNCLPSRYVPPSPTVGCNYECSTNADCTSPDQICADTAQGRRCRLDRYVNSESCTPPSYTAAQPTKPTRLPVAGAADTTAKFVLFGGAAVLLGALGLLLL
jgi:uncharacterized repeat protein (TIGR01451 family)